MSDGTDRESRITDRRIAVDTRATTLEQHDARCLVAYKAVLDHAESCPDCHARRCPVGTRLRRAEREARR